MSENSQNLKNEVLKLEDEDQTLRNYINKQPKDIWDKISVLIPLMSALFIAGIGGYATEVYRGRSLAMQKIQQDKELDVKQVQTIQSFMPQLNSGVPRQVEGALLSIAALGNPQLATKLATLYRNEGAIKAIGRMGGLQDVAQSENIISSLVTALQDADSNVRQQAALALGTIDKPDVDIAMAVAMLLYDPQTKVRESAVVALANMGGVVPTKIVHDIVLMLSDSDLSIQMTVLRLLPRFAQLIPAEDSAVIAQQLVDLMKLSENTSLFEIAVSKLAKGLSAESADSMKEVIANVLDSTKDPVKRMALYNVIAGLIEREMLLDAKRQSQMSINK